MEKVIDYCNKCRTHNIHNEKAKNIEADTDFCEEDGSTMLWSRNSYKMFECSKCRDRFTVTREMHLFHHTNPLTGKDTLTHEYSEEYCPPRLDNSLPEKEICYTAPDLFKEAYQEIIYCYNHNKLIACSASIKTLIEGICIHFKCDEKDIGESVKRMYMDVFKNPFAESLMSSLIFNRFYTFKHLHKPSKAELRIVIEILEDLIVKLYPLSFDF